MMKTEVRSRFSASLAGGRRAQRNALRAALICLSCLDMKIPAHIQYAARRIKSKAPHAKLLLGLWTATDAQALASLKAAVNADYAARSFHDALVIILQEASAGGSPRSIETASKDQNAVELPPRPMTAA